MTKLISYSVAKMEGYYMVNGLCHHNGVEFDFKVYIKAKEFLTKGEDAIIEEMEIEGYFKEPYAIKKG